MKRKRKPTTKHRRLDMWFDRALGAWVLRERGNPPMLLWEDRRSSMSSAREEARRCAPAKLCFHNLDGTISKGRNGEASYGCDSARRSG